jgi:hypothetical protein
LSQNDWQRFVLVWSLPALHLGRDLEKNPNFFKQTLLKNFQSRSWGVSWGGDCRIIILQSECTCYKIFDLPTWGNLPVNQTLSEKIGGGGEGVVKFFCRRSIAMFIMAEMVIQVFGLIVYTARIHEEIIWDVLNFDKWIRDPEIRGMPDYGCKV